MSSAAIMDRLAEATPAEMIASLERLVASGQVTLDQASDVYTQARRAQMLRNARTSLSNAIEWLVVAYLDGEGHTANGNGSKIDEAREHVQQAMDDFEACAKRAAVVTWRIEAKAS